MKKINKVSLIRLIIQIISFVLLPGLFIIIWNSVGDIIKWLVSGSFNFESIKSSLLTLFAVIPITVLWGRFFCGYMCAFGSMQELMNFISKKLNIKQIKINSDDHKYLSYIKYIVLVIFIFLWILGISNYTSLSPWNIFGMYSNIYAWSDLSLLISIGGLLLLLIIVGALFVERFFCRYLCPLGAIFSLISKCRIFKIKKNQSKCVGCNRCNKVCPMHIKVNEETSQYGFVKSGECIDCFKCINSCPKDALSSTSKEAVSATVAPILVAGLYYVGNIAIDNFSFDTVINSQETIGKYKDGTYSGTGQGYRGNVDVTVKVNNGKITSITIDSYKDDSQFFNKAKNKIIDEIISNQSTNVETVSGATYSSRGIIAAVANALGDSSSITNDDNMSNNKNKHDFPENREEDNANLNLDFENLVDGTYSGVGKGRNGNIEVSVKVLDGKVTSITIVSYLEDENYFIRAKDKIINDIISSQSLNVSTVSGATMSSRGIIAAVANALNINYTNNNSSNNKNKHDRPNGNKYRDYSEKNGNTENM